MGYQLGIDLGTTYTAAAVHRGGRVEIVTLGNRAASVPSVIFLREDESILTGDSANRRGLTEPSRVAREFKRRVGDPTPLLLGGTPYSAEALMARMLSWTVDQVGQLEGGPPDHVTLSHPANWGPYKKDLLEQAVRMADLAGVTTITEPEAAAVYYASNERVEVGSVIAVYDLGGGTFDAAVLRKEEGGWEVLGQPEGIERLGGIDFDEAVFAHVRRSLAEEFEGLDGQDPAVRSAVSRIRQDCIEAKEALSSDTEATIPVLLPTVQTEVRITRAEFEGMIRPTLQDTIGAMRRALDSAHVPADELTAVLLVGGSSRIPLVPQLISAEFGRPVAVDAHPKHAIALGAALNAAAHAGPEPEAAEVEVAAGEDVAQPATGAEPAPVEAAVSAETLAPTPTPEPAPPPPVVPEPVAPAPLPEPEPVVSAADVVPEPVAAPPAYQPPPSPAPPGGPSRRGGVPKWIVVVALVAVVAVVGAVLALGGGGDDGQGAQDAGDEVATTATTGAGGLDAAKAATVRIVARGSFTDPEIGEAQTTGSGSGFLIDESGIVVTNNHVVTGAASLEVFVPGDPDPKNAKVLGVSECSDLAVLDVDGDGYPSVDWADGGPGTGLEIFALGYPLGDAELTQTKGVVSKARAIGETNWTSVDNAIEHDATINPGNSGGPLVDDHGAVVGVNFAGSTDSGQFLAISAEGARELVETLRKGSDVEAIGVNGQAVVAEDGSVSGVWVAGVDSGSPADEAGVQPGDVIVTLEGVTLGADGTMSEYCDVLRSNEPDATLNIEVLRFATGELLKGQINGRALGSA